MKKYLATRFSLSALIIAATLGTIALATPNMAEAQNAPDKIRLMADALRARDSGNLDLAQEKAEELIRIAPKDENVQRLLASINREIERTSGNDAAASGPVYGQAPQVSVEAAMGESAGSSDADAMVQAATSAQEKRIAAIEDAISEAQLLADAGSYKEARNLLSAAGSGLTLSTATAPTLEKLDKAQTDLVVAEGMAMVEQGDARSADMLLKENGLAGSDAAGVRKLERAINAQLSDPYAIDVNQVNPDYAAQSETIRDLLTRGRAQYLNGDYDGASATFKEVEARDANNPDAKLFQTKIAELLGDVHKQNYYKTREQMMTEVDQNWERPKVFDVSTTREIDDDTSGLIQDKMNQIVIPQVNFSGMELTRVIETLSELSVEYDAEQTGVNIVPLFNPNDQNPRVNISLRNLSLDRILQFVTQQVNFAYDVGADAVTVAPSDSIGGTSATVTEFFPVSRATIIRLTGFRDGPGSSSGPVDPFAAPTGGGGSSGPSANEEVEALQNFFQRAGVNFETSGASLAFDGEQLIVTQTRRNLERMRTILRNYNEVKQVEIETKFLEVSQADLEEVGFDWNLSDGSTPLFQQNGLPVIDDQGNQVISADRRFSTGNRNLNDAFGISATQSAITRNGEILANNRAPDLGRAIDFAATASSLFTATGWSVNGYDVDFAIRALSRKSGSDLMSAPKVTVLSGKRANIVVAQELRYPESYGDIESTVSEANSGSIGVGGTGSSAAISITAGTPQDFVTRNVGVEMSVTPNVESDDTISLILEPRVTEFEGFVEYGGPSVAIAGSTTVTVPAGFFQPIFSTREVSTEVTIFDGATVVMGGLTRDEVKSIDDSVPVLGDIPGIGRLFRSEGETRQKRNLLIFVTANLVSPGGSPARQNYRNVNANSLFQNPTIMTPSGSVNRSIPADAE
ncbi:MAG: type II secretory pathway, component PulD [Verrucomicrobia bacterium]|jgi:general secretion pathway protein D|nr:type II secretory pathway, component PulD [Verrucomicrobiota bacterium]